MLKGNGEGNLRSTAQIMSTWYVKKIAIALLVYPCYVL